MSWYDDTFGPCPHGYIKPYCGACADTEAMAAKAARRHRVAAAESEDLRRRVAQQRQELHRAYSYIARAKKQDR